MGPTKPPSHHAADKSGALRVDASTTLTATNAPERLVGVGFRGCTSSVTNSGSAEWQDAWTTCASALGPDRAKALLIELSLFVAAVAGTTERKIDVAPAGCPVFCRDECLVISMVAAAQHHANRALTDAAQTLTGSSNSGDTIVRAQRIAALLAEVGLHLNRCSICPEKCALALACRPAGSTLQ